MKDLFPKKCVHGMMALKRTVKGRIGIESNTFNHCAIGDWKNHRILIKAIIYISK